MLLLLFVQGAALLILLIRLSSAPRRIPPIAPKIDATLASVSVVIPTLNERSRLPTCLEALRSEPVAEVLVVDSRSQDGTPEYVLEVQMEFPSPLHLVTDDPLPPGWVGRPWALHNGFLRSHPHSEWILGLDADTVPQPGLVHGAIQTAEAEGFDLVTLSPRFILKTAGEQWLQPALLVTLIYRFGATGDRQQFTPERVLANGQCFLVRRSVLEQLGGYELARSSFCDDVTLVRAAAQRGYRVGFLDGCQVIRVRMYTSLMETWQEWGRSLDLKDASTLGQTLGDCLFLTAVQGLPLPLVLLLPFLPAKGQIVQIVLGLNVFLVVIRWLLVVGIRNSYTEVGAWFWLSPTADPLAVMRIWLSALSRPKQWRGRTYGAITTPSVVATAPDLERQ
ncbi:MAG: glycosyltransferase [Oscillatoriales cyanobacterium SM2_2_1]|nr:glycosyltransferase [Oscillatoriales cyanobacterium SM2_2_1]